MLSAIKDFFESEGIYNVGFNQIFTASHDNNITNLISKETKIPTMQLEINKYYRNTEDMKNMLKLITALENIIYFLSK